VGRKRDMGEGDGFAVGRGRRRRAGL